MRTERKGAAASILAGKSTAADVLNPRRAYPCHRPVSTRKLLLQAAEILLVLQLPLSRLEGAGFWLLFERRLRRAYRGTGR